MSNKDLINTIRNVLIESRNKSYHKDLGKSTQDKRQAQFNKQAKMDDDDPNAYKPAPGDATGKTKPSKHTKKYDKMFGEEEDELSEKRIKGLEKKAKETGISYGILKKVYDRGMAAWRTGHRPGTTPQQWAFARVNSFATGGKTQKTTDADLWKQHKGQKESVNEDAKCPPATQDLKINTKNRDATTKEYNYGPLNVDEPGDYWKKVADHWDTTEAAAKKSLCSNCVAFDISERMKDCMPGETSDKDGELGYCWMHHFKCHSARTCHTWAKGGPIKDDKKSFDWQDRSTIKEGEGKYKGEPWEDGFKRRVVKTTSPEHIEKGYKWRIKGKERDEISIKLYKTKPDFEEYKKQMKRVAGHEFGG